MVAMALRAPAAPAQEGSPHTHRWQPTRVSKQLEAVHGGLLPMKAAVILRDIHVQGRSEYKANESELRDKIL